MDSVRCNNCRNKKYKYNLCLDCVDNLDFDTPKIKLNGIESLYIILNYNPFLRELMTRYKFRDETSLYSTFSELMIECIFKENISDKIDFMTYIPMYRSSYLKRGYNQLELIADDIEKKTMISKREILKKVKKTKDQVGLSFLERKLNLSGAFTSCKLNGENILLIDDVMTTGATLEEAARALKISGAGKIYAVVVAH